MFMLDISKDKCLVTILSIQRMVDGSRVTKGCISSYHHIIDKVCGLRGEGMKRKVVSLLFVFVFMIPVYATTEFTDVQSDHWFYDNVNQLVSDSRAIIKGYPDGSFRPSSQLSKDQFITMVVRAAGFEPGNASQYWAQNYIDQAISLGFLNQGDFTDYRSTINREEMSMIIVRALDYLEGTIAFSDLDQVNDVVLDASDFTPEYENYIQKTYKLGIITGYPDHTFKPQGVLTRAEASAVLIRLIQASERIAFDYASLYSQVHGDLESHLLGGSNWVNPLTASDYASAQEDWGLIESDMDYLPSQKDFDLNMVGQQQSQDTVMGALDYDENGPLEGHLESFERLLQRRMPQDQVDIVMSYLEKKEDKYSYLEHDEAFFYLNDNKYLVRLDEVMLYKGTVYQNAGAINFNIWYRDQTFIDDYEDNIIQIMPNTDVVIYH